jgi:hypothetical protein
MAPEFRRRTRASDTVSSIEEEQPVVSDEAIVLRNYDSTVVHDVTVRVLDASGDVTLSRTSTVPPQTVVSVREPLRRGPYRVEARVGNECLDSTECLIGSGPDEVALIEVGNGIVSVVEGVF